MPNSQRGEIEATLNGKQYTLCLTLGALAELENTFKAEDMGALVERFENGKLKSKDIAHIISAGLKGAGHDINADTVSTMKTEGGASGFIQIAVRLLQATFDV